MRVAIIAFILTLGLPAPLPAALEIAIIELRTHHAEQLLPLLQPLLGRDATLTGSGSRLLLQAPKHRVETLRGIIAKLDRPPRQLLISVYQGRLSDRDLAAFGITGNNAPPIKHWRTHSRLDTLHSLRVADGQAAFIATKTEHPLPNKGFSLGPDAIYRTSHRGFYVLARLAGEQVTLSISPFFEHPGHFADEFVRHRAASHISVRLGAWLELGGALRAAAPDTQRRHRTRDSAEQRILLKVDLLTPSNAP
jgi:hypothetical protein